MLKCLAVKPKFLSLKERATYSRLEDIIGCKWSTAVVAAIQQGVKRPGELERFIPGISKKILNERLRKLRDFGLIEKTAFAERLPHVEYHLSPMGRRLAGLLEQIRDLNDAMMPSTDG